MKIHQDVTELIGNTPLLLLRGFSRRARVVAKLEFLNPGGSAKDRVARHLLEVARQERRLAPRGRLLEKGGANTAVSLSWLAARLGYGLDMVVPDDVGEPALRLCRFLGASVHPTPPSRMRERWAALSEERPDAYRPDQFASAANVDAHCATTGMEIWRDTDGQVDAVVAGLGTGGTLAGITRYIRPRKPECRMVGVEPREAPVVSEGRHGVHGVPGLGVPATPALIRREDLDEVILVSSADAARMTRRLARHEGVLAGLSSGAVLQAAVEFSERAENAGKLVVIILGDGLGRYVGPGAPALPAEDEAP